MHSRALLSARKQYECFIVACLHVLALAAPEFETCSSGFLLAACTDDCSVSSAIDRATISCNHAGSAGDRRERSGTVSTIDRDLTTDGRCFG